MLGHDYLYPDPNHLITFLSLHDVARFMNEQGAPIDGLKLAFTYLMTSRGIPMIYYGDQIAAPGGNDPDNRRDFPGGWREDARNAFTAQGRTPAEQDVFARIQKLARLRSRIPDLRRAPMIQLAVSNTTYAYSRGNVIVLFNNASTESSIECAAQTGTWHDELGTIPDVSVERTTSRESTAAFIRYSRRKVTVALIRPRRFAE